MQTITTILSLPDKCPVDSVQGKVTKVYDPKVIVGKDTQSFLMTDAGNKTLLVKAWETTGLEIYQGKEVIISAGPKGGLTVNVFNSKVGLSMSRTCQIQFLAVHQAQGGGTPTPAPQNPVKATQSPYNGPSGVQGNTSIHPATIGAGLNKGVDLIIASGEPFTEKALWTYASTFVKVAQKMERGELHIQDEGLTPIAFHPGVDKEPPF